MYSLGRQPVFQPIINLAEDPPLDDGTSSSAAMEVFNAPEAKVVFEFINKLLIFINIH